VSPWDLEVLRKKTKDGGARIFCTHGVDVDFELWLAKGTGKACSCRLPGNYFMGRFVEEKSPMG